MAFKRIKDWLVSITSFRTGDVIPVDGPSGTAKMSKDDLLKETAKKALSYSVTDFVADKMKPYAAFVRECYLPNASTDNDYVIDYVSRGHNGYWFISINNNEYNSQKNSESSFFALDNGNGWLVLDWNVFDEGVQYSSLNISLSDLCFDKNNSPTIVRMTETDTSISSINTKLSGFELVYSSATDPSHGYIRSNANNGTPTSYSSGENVPLLTTVSAPCYAKLKVAAGDEVLTPYVNPANYIYAYPVLVDINNGWKETIDTRSLDNVVIDGLTYKKCTIPSDGWLIVCFQNSSFKVYSRTPTRKRKQPHTLTDSEKDAVLGYIGISSNLCAKKDNYMDYEVALKMNPSLLREIVENASAGKCTVLYDDNGYPSVMRKIPITGIRSLDSRLGESSEVHPAFVVNGVQKKCIYVGVFLNSLYNNVPVSWFGSLLLMRSMTRGQVKTKCAAKGTGWHMETIWERSLISLLAMNIQGTPTPAGNTCRGMTQDKRWLWCDRNETGVALPGTWSNGDRWVNGSQPNEWSHDKSPWGIYDIVGGYHEFVDLVKSVDGKLYLSTDNSFGSDESAWQDTGAWVTYNGSKIVLSNQKETETLVDVSTPWTDIACTQGYDSLSESVRKKLSLALLAPRLSSSSNAALWAFAGKWQLKNGLTTYQFMGGAEEYIDSGLGTNYFKYGDSEAHNNMGSRLAFVET